MDYVFSTSPTLFFPQCKDFAGLLEAKQLPPSCGILLMRSEIGSLREFQTEMLMSAAAVLLRFGLQAHKYRHKVRDVDTNEKTCHCNSR